MSVFDILNALILSLTIATILITLVAFLLYQVKKINFKSKVVYSYEKLDSIFFKRFAPHIEELIKKEEEANSRVIKKSPFLFFRLSALFAILSFVIVGAVIASKIDLKIDEDAVTPYASLEERVEAISKLREQGLLKKYSYSPSRQGSKISIRDSFALNKELNATLKHLKNQKIILMRNLGLEKIKDSKHAYALEKWQSFFKKYQIPYKVSTDFKETSSSTVYILPHYSSVNPSLKKSISRLNINSGVIFTGATDIENPNSNWFKKIAGVRFKRNQEPKIFQPSQFTTLTSEFNLGPGEILELIATDNRYFGLALDDSTVLSYESSYSGSPHREENDWVAKAVKKENSYWLAWDPDPTKVINAENELRTNRQDYVFLQLLASLTKRVSARISWWPNATKSVAVLSVDTEDQFTNIEKILKIFSRNDAPVTLFLVASLYEKNIKTIGSESSYIELASHGDQHNSFADQVGKIQFDRIQESRHIIEEYSRKKVVGFRPPFEESDNKTIESIQSNRLEYIFAGQQCMRLSPCFLENNLVMFPRLLSDDVSLVKDRTLISPENILKAMRKEIRQVSSVGGGYFLSLHTQVFGQSFYLPIIDKVIKTLKSSNDFQLITFKELASWWRLREDIDLNIVIGSAKGSYIELVNNGDASPENLHFYIFNAKVKSVKNRSISSHNRVKCVKEANKLSCVLDKISPGEKIRYDFSQ